LPDNSKSLVCRLPVAAPCPFEFDPDKWKSIFRKAHPRA
jgi:hypothetical protein